jgi:hypothetical protein
MAFWKLCKNGNLIKNKSGEFVDRNDYDNLLRENRFLKKELTWENFTRKFNYLLDKDKNLKSEIKFASTIYLQGIQFLVESSKKQEKATEKERIASVDNKKVSHNVEKTTSINTHKQNIYK